MQQEVMVSIRKFERSDIPYKVEWINNPANNTFLHYDLPLSIAKTERWFESHRTDDNRYDAVIEVNGKPVGTIGLLNIDRKNRKAEYYVAMGEGAYKGKGVAKRATRLLLKYGFEELKLNRIYLFTEINNIKAQKLFEVVGFIREGVIRQDIISRGRFVDRLVYGILRKEWEGE